MFLYLPTLRLITIIIILVTFSSGCSTTGHWGKHSTFSPSWQSIKNAARDSLYESRTWAPAIGGTVMLADDFDQQVVEWAIEKNPVFGNQENAQKSSDLLRDLSHLNYLATVVSVPSESTQDKLKGLSLGLAAIRVNKTLTGRIKGLTNRQRPLNKTSYESFPSQHTSEATVAASLASRNISHIPTQKQKYWQWASYTLAGMTGWARIEAGHHYPSDVLYGFALGNFIASFFTKAFIDPDNSSNVDISFYGANNKNFNLSVQYKW